MAPRRMILTALVVGLAACDSTGPQDGARLAIDFATMAPAASSELGSNSTGADLVITGSNGVLRITSMHMIVSEFEVERQESACEGSRDSRDDDDDGGDDDCEEFETGPFFLELPLNGSVSVVSQEVPAGAYTELEFEVEDLEMDEDGDDDVGRGMTDLQRAMRDAGFPEWPGEASLVVRGTFTPTGGVARPFTTFFEAEIEIELDFEPPLVVDDVTRTVTIEIDPSVWFRTFANTVLDLSAFDYATTHKVMEFEAKFKNGFQRMEFDD